MISRAATTVAASSYAANCALGIAVATGRLRTGRAHWVHHALYIATTATTAAATAALIAERGTRGLVLVPALIPLAAIPFAGTHGWRHPALAATVAPFQLAALRLAWSPQKRGAPAPERRAGR